MTPSALLSLLRAPQTADHLQPQDWNRIIPQARNANLTARLAEALRQTGRLEAVPARVRAHLEAGETVAGRQRIATLTEAMRVKQALDEGGMRLVLLKGAAYLAAGLPAADGRVFGDIDLIVPEAALPESESVLLRNGWISTHHNAYDQRYYRQWMHEIPPLRHVVRDSVLDVHHNILPRSSRHTPPAALLLAAAVPAVALPGAWVLAPEDMVLHSACHLFHEGELDNGLRDLIDLDRLLRHFGRDAEFSGRLAARADVLHLQMPLRYALAMCGALLDTPLPEERTWPRGLRESLMHWAYVRALQPNHASADDAWTELARYFLYVRAHWLRMRPHQLAAHLTRKAWRRWSGLTEDKKREDAQVALAEQAKRG
ncbi:nucleotidyltransferase family protein [Niveibacterium sp. SC-1]|uniref:nucleotidyltransferase domain-containing protein n=1 Tax=Niveibacterium sp. SC-1 TaxID=3135646 RepID=UPI00311F4848